MSVRPTSSTLAFSFLAVVLITATGCQQQFARIFHRPPPTSPTVLALPDTHYAAETTGPRPTTQPTTGVAPTPTDPTAPLPAAFYTAPGRPIQKLALLAMLTAAVPDTSPGNAAKQASESAVSASRSSLASTGISGLGAPQPRTLTAIVGQPGLQRGFAIGLGPARRDNVFTPRANPLTGPNGRCQELVRSGFFRDATACQQFFGR